jgi:hypothetical protein
VRSEPVVELAAFGERHDGRTADYGAIEVAHVRFGSYEPQHDAVGRHATAREQGQVIGAVVQHTAAKIRVHQITHETSARQLDVVYRPPANGLVEGVRAKGIELQAAD